MKTYVCARNRLDSVRHSRTKTSNFQSRFEVTDPPVPHLPPGGGEAPLKLGFRTRRLGFRDEKVEGRIREIFAISLRPLHSSYGV